MKFTLYMTVAVFLIATGCTKTANITLGDEITSRGMINRAELALGQVYLWNRAEDSATRLVTIAIPSAELAGGNRNARDVEAKFERGIEISANAELKKILDDDLEVQLQNEATNRTLLKTSNSSQLELSNPFITLDNYVDGSPKGWYGAMETIGATASNDYQIGDDEYLVLVSEVVQGTALNLQVDRSVVTTAGAEFASQVDADINFKISDVGSVTITSADPTVLLADVTVYKTRRSQNGMGFTLQTDRTLLGELHDAISRASD